MLALLIVTCLLFCGFNETFSGSVSDRCDPWELGPNQRYAHGNCLKENNLNRTCLIGCNDGFRFPGRRKRYRPVRCRFDSQTGSSSWFPSSIPGCEEIKCDRKAMPRRIRYFVTRCNSVVPLGSKCFVRCRFKSAGTPKLWGADCKLKSPRRVHAGWEFNEEPDCTGISPPDPCQGRICENGGSCRVSGFDFICDCRPGYHGLNCGNVELDPCLGQVCQNDGACRKSGTDYICDCKPGFAGVNCGNDLREVRILADTFMDSIASISPATNIPANAQECESKTKFRMLGKSCPSRRKRQTENETDTAAGAKVKRDILILIDESVSVGDENFKKLTKLAQAIISSFCGEIGVDKEMTKIAVMTFDREQHMYFDFSARSRKAELLAGIGNISFNESTSGFTCLVEGLRYAGDVVFDIGHGATPLEDNTRRDIFLFSDGCAYCSQDANVTDQMLGIARSLIEQQITVTTILVGSHEDPCIKQMSAAEVSGH